ncbi:MAG TPA: Rrf2 family transcriptional regulator [Gemmatimonadales bacterium]|jgi:Rrf2 family protein|nr:Rrf2 family transcriptional regulator [Gemmatimonadales bacterium]
MLSLPETARYALRAVSYIAEHEAKGPVPVSEVADALEAPQNYLSKTLCELGTLGVLRSVRGAQGGYRLGAPASRLRLAAIVQPFLAVQEHQCIMGHPRCRDDAPCGAHLRWKEVRETARNFFMELTLQDLIGR